MKFRYILLLLFISNGIFAQPWIPDLGNGRYKNLVLFADYSDPDIIRIDDAFLQGGLKR